jgi:hypothetical protein
MKPGKATLHIMLLLALAVVRPDDQSAFSVQAELQGLYEEISQATLQFVTGDDIDQFHEVLYTPEWVFIDATGKRSPWSQVREEQIQALTAPPFDWMNQAVQKVSLTSGGATAVVSVTTVRTIVDTEGKYGQKGSSHTLAQTTPFRDVWIKMGDTWKMQSREQIGKPTVSVSASQYEKYLKDYSVPR